MITKTNCVENSMHFNGSEMLCYKFLTALHFIFARVLFRAFVVPYTILIIILQFVKIVYKCYGN
jgi:hypothetical protein